eukprot:m.32737 g.32737  ORF g.32737 m.32737 type:complete len:288 (+) comp12180_c0_seq1:29-892(+)
MGRKTKAKCKPVTATTSNALVKRVVASGLASKRNKRKHAIAIGYVHTLNKKLAKAKDVGNHAEVARLEAELAAIGGLDAYQQCSLKSEALGVTNTSRWVVKQLKENELHTVEGRKLRFDSEEPLSLLDVGALSANYSYESKWVKPKAIDLNSQHPAVEQLDFFDLPEAQRFQVIALCLVINFVPNPVQRGKMLLKCHRHLLDNGLLAVMTPKACVENSRYTTNDSFVQLLADAGFVVVSQHLTTRLACYLCVKGSSKPPKQWAATSTRKVQLRAGGKRNNFVVTLEN